MHIANLEFKNIGPFKEGALKFIDDDAAPAPVTIITGENGTGKTIVLDAIRKVFLGWYENIERDIEKVKNDAPIRMEINSEHAHVWGGQVIFSGVKTNIKSKPLHYRFEGSIPNPTWTWAIDYWTSKLASDSFKIREWKAPNVNHLYQGALSGIHKNADLTQTICFFDYLRTSENPAEKILGEKLYQTLKEIIQLSLTDGEFLYVKRTNFEPIVRQMGTEVTLEKLSSGNLYLIQRMVSMLNKMYAIHILNKTDVNELCQAKGILLIDEAENHLHPKWQKTFINSILQIFPNLQIILTTHSPFIVASVENARVYVCKSEGDYAVIKDETDIYSNKPIEEILLTPLFGETLPFNQKISNLMMARKQAIKQGNKEEQHHIEMALKAINPQYFSFFDIDELLQKINAE